jgi:hypothetical protein
MGGGFICNNYMQRMFLSPSDYIMSNGNSQNIIQQSGANKITNKTSYILYNILENNQDGKLNKRYSDYLNYEKRPNEKISKNNGKLISTNDCPNTSFNETTFFNQRNEDTNKKISSNNNSSNFNGSLQKGEEVEDNNINSYCNNNNNRKSINENKHNSVMKKIKGTEELNKKRGTNFNCNMGENNIFLINISRGSSFLLNHNINEQCESTTPKMMIEKKNIEDFARGRKSAFSHYCKRNNENNNQCIINNQLIANALKRSLDMNKYSEEMLKTINSLRKNPADFIKQIDYLLNNNIRQTEEGIFLISGEVDEKIKLLDNYKEMFDKTKNILNNLSNSPKTLSRLEDLIYKDELEIFLDESNYGDVIKENEDDIYSDIESEENDIRNLPSKLNNIYDDIKIIDDGYEENDIDLIKYNEIIKLINLNESFEEKDNSNQKNNEINKNIKLRAKKRKTKKHNINANLNLSDDDIANLILQKRKEIKNDYPKNIFKISVIKDIQLSLLIQITMEEFFKDNNKKTLKDIIFDSNYKYFALGWSNEINRNFISVSCFA